MLVYNWLTFTYQTVLFCLINIKPFVPLAIYTVYDLHAQTKLHLSSLVQWVVGVTKNMFRINEMPLSTMLFLHGWSFRLKCHCLCSFSLMFLLNFTHLTCSVHKMWIILTGFTGPPCVSTCTDVTVHTHVCRPNMHTYSQWELPYDVYRRLQSKNLWWSSEKVVM